MRAVVACALLLAGCVHPAGDPGAPADAAPAAAPVVLAGQTDGLAVDVFAGHAVVRSPWTEVRADVQGPDGLRHYGPGDGELRLGFLRSATTYEASVHGLGPTGEAMQAKATFTTSGQAGWGDGFVRPGALVAANVAHCSLAFILRDATNATLYALTAAHCVSLGAPLAILDDLQDVEPQPVGVVVHIAAPGPADYGDWALARLDETARGRVDPATEHWSGPTGVFAAPAADGVACHIGWGAGVGWANESRSRCARLLGYAADAAGVLEFDGVVTNGDSGSPVVEHATGRAMGMVVRAQQGSDFGAIDLCHVLLRLREAGHDLALATAPYSPAPRPAVSESPLDPGPEAGAGTACPPHVQAGYWP